ncbi:MAG: hypothetical protein ACREC9_14935 [Methylocella sp.]
MEIGAISGDRWAGAAFTGALFMGTDRSTSRARANSGQTARARANAETALALAPFNGAAWLFGETSGKFAGWREPGWDSSRNVVFHRAECHLAPRRLERAATSSALADNDPQAFIKSDIRAIGPL